MWQPFPVRCSAPEALFQAVAHHLGECGGLLAVGKLFDEAQIDRLFGNLERVFVVDTDFDTRVPVGISVSFAASSATAFKASCIGGAAAAIAKPSRTTAVFALFLRFTSSFCAAVAKIQRHRAHSPSCSASRQLPSNRRELEPRRLDGGFGSLLFAGIFTISVISNGRYASIWIIVSAMKK